MSDPAVLPPVQGLTEAQGADVRRLAARASLWGAVACVGGAWSALSTILAVVGPARGHGAFYQVAATLAFLAVGAAFLGAGRALRSAVDAPARDLHRLVAAFGHLARAMRVQVFAAALVAFAWAAYALFG